MLTVSRPVGLLIAVSVVGIGVYAYAGTQSDPAAATKPSRGSNKVAGKASEYTSEDFTARFDPPPKKLPLRNVFVPLLRNDSATSSTDTGTAVKDILRVPGNLAGGNPNWIFTGFAVINGEKTALLEDRSNHHSEFVKEGSPWKTSRILRISAGSIVLDDMAGGRLAVMRFDPLLDAKSAAKTEPDAGLKPVDPGPALQGAIGPGGPPNGGRPRINRGQIQGGQMIINGNAISISPGP
jgi:hypothetical protein